MAKKQIPIGKDDFKKIREEEFYYVDKSLFIEELLENRAEVTLLSRPRRFGKTLNMSMLKYFFNIENSEENRKLFKGLKIENTNCMEYQGKFPVIYLSFKDLKMDNWELCLEQLKEVISELYKAHFKVKDVLDIDSLNDFNMITSQKASNVKFMNSISKLSKYLNDYYGKKVIILIDEYDTPLTTAYTMGYYEEAMSFFRNLMSGAYKSNENLEFGVLTGITRVAKESIFSGFNNPDVATILDNRYKYFGFTESEVEELLKYYELDYELEEVKTWYNGYRFGDTQIYNPWSILKFAKSKELKAYWVNTSSNDLIVQILKAGDSDMLSDLETLFKGESIKKYLSEDIVFSNLKQLTTVWSLFFFSGYLTFSGITLSPITGQKLYNLVIPNEEIKSFFKETFINEYSFGEIEKFESMIVDLYLGNMDTFAEDLKNGYKKTVSYHDDKNDEKYYHQFAIGIALTLDKKFEIYSNRESGRGRYDIALYPLEKGHHGIIFELKKTDSPKELKKKSLEALEQIKNMEYEADMKSKGVKEIIRVGIAFCGKDSEVSWER